MDKKICIQKAKELMKKGYRKVSRKSFILSRVDRKDWKEHMADSHSPWSRKQGLKWVEMLNDSAADHYRRVYSKDNIVVEPSIFKYVKTSCHDSTGFVSLEI